MKTLPLVAAVSALLLASLAGCSGAGRDASEDDADPTSSSDVASQALHGTDLAKSLVGDWQVADSLYPRVSLAGNQTYAWDTGIRCVRAPCPSSDVGTWNLYAWGWRRYIGMFSDDGTVERWYRVVQHPFTGADTELVGVFGTTEHLVRTAELPPPPPPPVDAGAATDAPAYTCPPDGWINCMPSIGTTPSAACGGDYHTWIQANCPGVQFAY